MEKADGRGAGPVRLVVEGSLTRMLELAEAHVGRVILEGSCPRPLLEDSTYRFRYYVDLQQEDLHALPDVQVIARLLDPGDVPVTTAAIAAALTGGPPLAPHRRATLRSRIVIALEYLKRRGLVRRVKLKPKQTGWVWDHYPFTDEAWVARANMIERPAPIARNKAPEAHADIAAIAALLDHGDVPDTKQRMLAALAGGALPEDPNDRARPQLRWRSAIDYLRHRKLARGHDGAGEERLCLEPLPLHRPAWKARADMVADHGTYPLPVIRFKAPKVHAVIIGGPKPANALSRKPSRVFSATLRQH